MLVSFCGDEFVISYLAGFVNALQAHEVTSIIRGTVIRDESRLSSVMGVTTGEWFQLWFTQLDIKFATPVRPQFAITVQAKPNTRLCNQTMQDCM